MYPPHDISEEMSFTHSEGGTEKLDVTPPCSSDVNVDVDVDVDGGVEDDVNDGDDEASRGTV